MTYLLGRQDCVENLRKDVTDLQGTILDVTSRAGPARFPSWKFPDKISCDLDLVALLDHYDFVEGDEEFSQHSHIVLLELVVDRLLLLLQGFTRYNEILLGDHKSTLQSKSVGPSMSIGLVVKTYWNSLLKLGNLYQNGLKEKFPEKETSALHWNGGEQERQKDNPNRSASPLKSIGENRERRSQSAAAVYSQNIPPVGTPFSVANDCRTIGSQTVESSLVPCDACARSQSSLKEVGKAIIGICQSQNLPSSLCRFQEVTDEILGETQLSASDMAYWAAEQSKDLARINKHFTDLLNQVKPLKKSLAASEAEQAALKKEVQTFEEVLHREKGECKRKMQECENKLQAMHARNADAVKKLEVEKEELKKDASSLKEELKNQQASIQDLEQQREKLLQEMRTQMVDKSVVLVLEGNVRDLNMRLATNTSELSATIVELDKERAKFISLTRQQESLQAKHRALLQQVDSLDQECEGVRQSLEESDEKRAQLQEELSQLTSETASLRCQLQEQKVVTEQLQEEKQKLEGSVSALKDSICELEKQVQEQKQREKLLMDYPDLCPPSQCQLDSTGDIITDMEKQMQANSVRIVILEEQNSRLRNSLQKLKESVHPSDLKVIPQMQLWSDSALSQKDEASQNSAFKDDVHLTDCTTHSWLKDRDSDSEHSVKISKTSKGSIGPWEKRSPPVTGYSYAPIPVVSIPKPRPHTGSSSSMRLKETSGRSQPVTALQVRRK
ncbi:coiled-coil domain-containing protein 157 isoform X1 [Erpetoichthys calabaricus]|uniref:coiled-coil domain-containing protein 157 isoform X1 n=1 Tax=Erpetoichthys calabaricus TaxID=27687 RepID=UPI002234E855|nr:coiled-coil domain-containing protein 157 isoform X1 [Erpetoichthys calabaricus]